MKLSIMGHACFSVKAGGLRLVVDPWLSGPVFWGAWSHCPEPVYDDSIFEADCLFITHWHHDHFHADSLRRFRKDAHVFVPRFPVSLMADELREIGFHRVTEMVHDRRYPLGPDFAITALQIQYLDDSVLVVEADGVVVVDLNDAKPLPPSWRAIGRRCPRPDFMFRSHSPAWSFPTCYTFEDEAEAVAVERDSYKAAFRQAARVLEPRFAVPFASGVCHLHREARSENRHLVPGAELADYLERHPLPDGTECVLMPPGASWSPESGFDGTEPVVSFDLPAEVERLAAQHEDELARFYAREDAVVLDYSAFSDYFRQLLRALGPFRRLLRSVWVFRLRLGESIEYWSVDFARSRLGRGTTEPESYSSLIDVHPAVLSDALETRIVGNIEIAKRWRVHVRRGGVTGHLLLWVLISLFEAGYLTPRNFLSPRFIVGYARRLPEVFHYVLLLVRVLRRGVAAAAETVSAVESN
ncbi:MAG: MBL fold metallo-hydrolase [Myxococcota bacterium]